MRRRRIAIVGLAAIYLLAVAFIVFWFLQPRSSLDPHPGVALEDASAAHPSQPEGDVAPTLNPYGATAPGEADGNGAKTPVGQSGTEDQRGRPDNDAGSENAEEATSQEPGPDGPEESTPPETTLAVTISGRVVDTSGLGVANAIVMAWYRFLDAEGNDQQRQIPMRVGNSGPGGHYTAVIQARVHEGTQTFDAALSARASALASTIPVQVAGLTSGEQRRGVDLTVVGGGTVSGRVVDQHGAPVSGAMVFGTPDAPLGKPPALPPGTLGKPIGDSAKTGPDGRYLLKNMPPGPWLIRASGLHHPFGTSAIVKVEPGKDPKAANIVLRTGSGAKLRLLTATGMPIHRDANGKLVRVDVHLTMRDGWKTFRVAEPDEQGKITLASMLLTTVEIRIEAQGYDAPAPIKLNLIAGQTIDLGELRLTPATHSEARELVMTTG